MHDIDTTTNVEETEFEFDDEFEAFDDGDDEIQGLQAAMSRIAAQLRQRQQNPRPHRRKRRRTSGQGMATKGVWLRRGNSILLKGV